MITLYQLHWSHFVEKVRWALDFKGLDWSAVDVDPMSKRQMNHLPCKAQLDSGETLRTVPAIHDDATGTSLVESSEILAYLDRQYPQPPLYPESESQRAEVLRWTAWLDSILGLSARRLAYAQLALEHPAYIAQLFVPEMGANTFKARVAGCVVSGILARRFRFNHMRDDRVYEQLEQCLLFVARSLEGRRYLVGERFTAADLTLAALMRPTTLVPFFRDHPHLQSLFAWREALLRDHQRDRQVGYETALDAIRRRRGWSLGSVSWLPTHANESSLTAIPTSFPARNDQQSVGRRPMLMGMLWYWQLRRTCGLEALALDARSGSRNQDIE